MSSTVWLRADQLDQVAGLQAARRQRRNVEDDAVHRDAADEGKLDAVAPGRSGRRGAASRRHSRARSSRCASAQPCDRRGRSRRRHRPAARASARSWPTGRPPGRIGLGLSRHRVDAVERRPRPRQVEMICLPEKDAGRIGQRCRRRRQLRCAAPRTRRAAPAFAGCSGSSAQARWLITSPTAMPSKASGVAAQPLDLGGRQAEPRHAAVDLQRRREPAPGALGSAAPRLDLLDAVQHGNDAGRDALVLGAGRNAVQHLDRRLRAERGAQRQRLAEMRDEECLAAFGDQRRRHLGRAEAIAVGLDDAGRRRRRRACA